jgi:hypothetical protein
MPKAVMWASLTCFAVVLYLPGFALALLVAFLELNSANPDSKALFALIASPFLGGLFAAAIGFIAAGIYALLGGWALAHFKGWIAMAVLLAALLAGAAVNQLGGVFYTWLLADVADWSTFPDLLLSAFGWWVGLLASGFPKIVSGYRAPISAALP